MTVLRFQVRWAAAMLMILAASAAAEAAPPKLSPVVEVEEEVYQYQTADNGAGPMWCGGSTCLVRLAHGLYASGLDTLPGVKPLNNCRWTIYRRTEEGWKLWVRDEQDRN